ncbi:MmcQ/YjbR family DNA-binding protein [Jatrophihabitans sp. DSM 45814]
MDRDEVMNYALAKPGAWPDSPWGEDHDVAKVGDKIFLFPSSDEAEPSISVKNTAEVIEELKQRYPDHVGPAPYLNKRLWARVLIEQLPTEEIRELIDDSYELVVASLPKSKRPQGTDQVR